jgi:hypothetical protein
VTAENRIRELLSNPVGPDWTIDRLAEDVICAIAARGPGEAQEFMLDADATTDRQSRRLLRPLLACLANKSAAETGSPPELYRGRLIFRRPSHDGSVWILGQFENMPGTVRVALRRSTSPPQDSERSACDWSLAGDPERPVVVGTQIPDYGSGQAESPR